MLQIFTQHEAECEHGQEHVVPEPLGEGQQHRAHADRHEGDLQYIFLTFTENILDTTNETCCSTILLPFLLTAGRSARRPDPSLPRPELTPMHMISWLAFSPFLTPSSSRGISLANWG